MGVTLKREVAQAAPNENEVQLFAQAHELEEHIAKLKKRQAGIFLQIATQSCPYKPGDKLTTNQGLGKVGLVVHEVISPAFPKETNRWAIQTYAISKSGEVTRRVVGIEEWQTNLGAGIEPLIIMKKG
jgi:hypothetical protein